MNRQVLRWNIHWPTTLFALLLLPLLLGLGRWQLDRAEQKRVAQSAFEIRESAEPTNFANLPAEPETYTRAEVTGRYDNAHSFLLDNRILHGRFGYEIITPFFPKDNARRLLINRGWVEGDPARVQRPHIDAIEGDVHLTGYVYRDTTRFTYFGNGAEQRWPKLIQNLKADDLQRQLGAEIFPFILRLDENTAGAYRTEWQIFSTGFGPERHIAYAVTWFAMAFTLVIFWLSLSSNIWQLIKGSQHSDD